MLPEEWPAFGTPAVDRRERRSRSTGPFCRRSPRGPAGSVSPSWPAPCPSTCPVATASERIGRARSRGQAGRLYGKIHLFDVDVDGRSRARIRQRHGRRRVRLCELCGVPVALTTATTCGSLRCSQLTRAWGGLFTVPAAFLERTGRDHWEVLLRARAIETQSFVVAAAQWASCPAATARMELPIERSVGHRARKAGDGEGVSWPILSAQRCRRSARSCHPCGTVDLTCTRARMASKKPMCVSGTKPDLITEGHGRRDGLLATRPSVIRRPGLASAAGEPSRREVPVVRLGLATSEDDAAKRNEAP